MASSFLFLLFLVSFFSFSYESAAALAPSAPPPKSLIFPIRKNDTTLQYSTTFTIGSNHTIINAVIDLGGQFTWFDCGNSKSHSTIPCAQPKCKSAPASVCSECTGGGSDDDCRKDMCGVYIWNPFRDSVVYAFLEEDTLKVPSSSSDGHGKSKLTYYDSHHFSFSCAPIYSLIFDDLPGGSNGLVGLGRTKTSLPAQLSSSFNLPHKFAICFPSSSKDHGTGRLFVGGGPYYHHTSSGSSSLIETPLIVNPVTNQTIHDKGEASDEYFINVKSIKVGGKAVPIAPSLLTIDKNGNGGSKIGTRTSYTVLEASIYKQFVSAFIGAAKAMKIKRVKSVAPFGACYSARSIKQTNKTGPAVPDVELVLDGVDDAVWRIYGSNSMVQSSKKNVVCLAFVEAEKNVLDPSRQRTSIVLGGHQLENHIVEFDLVANKLSVSSSLLLHDTSCTTHL